MHNAFTSSTSASASSAFTEQEEIMMDQDDIFEGPNLENHREERGEDCGCHACTGIGFDPRTPEQKERDARIERAREAEEEMRAADKLSWESQNSFEEWGDPEFDSSED